MQIQEVNGTLALGQGLEKILNPDEFRAAMHKVDSAAFDTIFSLQREGKLEWQRAGEDLRDFVTTVTVKDGRGLDVTLPAILFTSVCDMGWRSAYLMLGSKQKGPCRNSFDERVKHLYTEVTREPWRNSV